MKHNKYKTPVAFRRALEDRIKIKSREQGADIQRMRRSIAFDRLLCRLFDSPDEKWILKGGYTFPRSERQNSRVKDLVDMLILIDLGLEPSRLWNAINNTFKRRDSHPVPEKLENPPNFWSTPYSRLAQECGLSENIGEGFAQLDECGVFTGEESLVVK